MKLLIIAGFLGSGKTTLLLEVARRLMAVLQMLRSNTRHLREKRQCL